MSNVEGEEWFQVWRSDSRGDYNVTYHDESRDQYWIEYRDPDDHWGQAWVEGWVDSSEIGAAAGDRLIATYRTIPAGPGGDHDG